MSKSDLKDRKWRSPQAEHRAEKESISARKRYRKRLDHLVEVIVATVQQEELHCYLEAPTEPMLLLALKKEVDRRPGGFMARHPDPSRKGDSVREQSERFIFMREAYNRAVTFGLIKLDTKNDSLLLYVYNPPKYTLRRDGQTLVDYIPTKDELTGNAVEPDIEPEFVPTGRILARIGRWL